MGNEVKDLGRGWMGVGEGRGKVRWGILLMLGMCAHVGVSVHTLVVCYTYMYM